MISMIKKKLLTIFITTSILLICFFVGLYIIGIKSEPYKFALKYIDSNKLIIENIGLIESRRLAFFGYSVRYSGTHGHAEYKILVKSKKNKCVVYLNLEKSVGIWSVIAGNLVLNNGRIIPLTSVSNIQNDVGTTSCHARESNHT